MSENPFDTPDTDKEDPWSGEKKDFDPPKPIEPATYSLILDRWGEFEGQDYVDMYAKISPDSQNGSEIGREVQHRFWANDKWRLKSFLQDVLGPDEFQTFVDSQGGKIKIAYIAQQTVGCSFLADVYLRNVEGYEYPFADIDLKTVAVYSTLVDSEDKPTETAVDGTGLPF